jgi:hypothetical protein
MKFPAFLLACLSLVVSTHSRAGGEENMASACATLEFMAKIVTLNALLPADHDDPAELEQMQTWLRELNRRACQPAILTGFTRGNSYYESGQLISSDLYYQPWRFPNGQLLFAAPGFDTPIYYPNGQLMASHWMHGDQALFWPNGNLATEHFRRFEVTWFYPDGHNIITYEAGRKGARWFYPFPRFDGLIGQEEISKDWGEEDEDFTFLNFTASGELFTTRERIRRSLVFDDIDLLDVPGVLLLITRLYQQQDSAKEFTPADVNITGAPF